MPEPVAIHARRAPILAPSASGAVRVLPAADRFVLQMKAPRGAVLPAGAGGFDLSGPLNSARGTPERFAARLGPGEWLLVCPEGEGTAAEPAIAADLAGRFFSLVAVGHRNAAFLLSGPHAADILNAGIALDLSDTAFPPGSATRTLLGKTEVVLVRVGEAFRLECWRSFAPYVHAFLQDAAREFA